METNSLKEFFECLYRQGGTFQNEEYEWNNSSWTWLHRRTRITVWGDALDLTHSRETREIQVVYHYTNALAFKNITNEAKENIEIWASLEIEGPKANAWYGRGLYTVPYSPDGWKDIHQLCDNNFRNMMKRDLQNHGEDYVQHVYPPRCAYCIPVLVQNEDAFDVTLRRTPEMVEKDIPLGHNLKLIPLCEPSLPKRFCIVVRVEDKKKHVQNPSARLLDVVKLGLKN